MEGDIRMKDQYELYSPSTIAMAIYNQMVISQCALTVDDMRAALLRVGIAFNDAALEMAISGLLNDKKVILQNGDGTYSSIDKERRPVVVRDRCDAAVDEESRIVSGGWNGWRVNKIVDTTIPIEEVIQ
jgi:hypothetical protein